MSVLFKALLFAVGLSVLPVANVNAATYLFHNDHLGTPQALTDESQQVIWRGEQDPFGEVDVTTSVVEQNIRFPGQYYDVETGLHYNHFRDYDLSIGRYVQSDPIGLLAGPSTYTYVSNNPAINTDVLGLNRTSVNLGSGYTGGIDKFNVGGSSSFEIHVYNPKGKEVGMFGPEGWFNKHGLSGKPDGIPDSVEAQCKGQAVDLGRRMGKIPHRGQGDITGDKWKKYLKGLPLIGPLIEMTAPSPQRVPPGSPISEYM